MSDVSTKLNTFSFIFYANCSKTRVNCGEPVWKLISLLSSKCESSHTGSQSSLFYYYVILRQMLNVIAMFVRYRYSVWSDVFYFVHTIPTEDMQAGMKLFILLI